MQKEVLWMVSEDRWLFCESHIMVVRRKLIPEMHRKYHS